MHLGPTFRAVREVAAADGTAVATLVAPAALGDAALDATGSSRRCSTRRCTLLAVLLPAGDDTYLPIALDRLHVVHPAQPPREDVPWRSVVRLQGDAGAALLTATVDLLDPAGVPIAALRGLRLVRTSTAAIAALAGETTDPAGAIFALSWEPLAADAPAAAPVRVLILGDASHDGHPGNGNATRPASPVRSRRPCAPAARW